MKVLPRNDANHSSITRANALPRAESLLQVSERCHCASKRCELASGRRRDLSKNLISDPSPLAGLAQLTALSPDNNRVTNVTPLLGLKELSTISLDFDLISDAAPFLTFPKLKALGLVGDPLDCSAQAANLSALRTRVALFADCN